MYYTMTTPLAFQKFYVNTRNVLRVTRHHRTDVGEKKKQSSGFSGADNACRAFGDLLIFF